MDDWFDESEGVLSAINITPLVDVALVLLIIFMITAPMMVQGADVRLPRTAPMDRLPEQSMFLTATADEQVELNGVVVPRDELGARLARTGQPGDTVYLRADESLSYGFIMSLIEQVKLAEMNLALATTVDTAGAP